MNTISHYCRHCALSAFLLLSWQVASAGSEIPAYQLSYEEQDTGTDAYATQYIVSDRYLRINTVGDKDGYILYDDKTKTIYSISHLDKRTLVMKDVTHKAGDMASLVNISYQPQKDAPEIAGKAVYDYRMTDKSGEKKVCTNLQVAQGLLPQVTKILQNYKMVIAANQISNIFKTPEEFRTNCFMADQVYDAGAYYDKGLPILEWHGNGSRKMLVNYEKVEVNPDTFKRPENYTEFGLNSAPL